MKMTGKTTNKTAVKETKNNENTYREFYEDAPLPYQSLAEDGSILDVNRAWLEMLGYSRDEVLGRGFWEFLTEDCRKVFAQRFPEFKKKGQTKDAGFEMTSSDGSVRSVSIDGKVMRNKEGNFIRTQCIVRDITEQKKMQESLSSSEEMLRQVSENFRSGVVWMTTADLRRILYVSPVYEEIFGLKCSDLYENPTAWRDIIVEEDRGVVLDYLKTSTGADKASYLYPEFRILRPDGKIRWISVVAFPVRDEKGSVSRIVGISSDVTQQRAMEIQLRASEERYRRIFQQNPVSMLLIDSESLDILLVNDAAVEHYGWSHEEFSRMNLKDMRPGDDVEIAEQIYKDAKTVHKVSAGVWKHRKKNGTVIFVDITTILMDFDGKEACLAICIDVTKEIKARESLLESEAKYRILVENADVSMVILQKGRVKYASPRTEAVLGCTCQQLTEGNVFDLIHLEDRRMVVERYKKRLAGEGFQPCSIRIIDSAGKERWVFLTAALASWEGETAVLAVLRDITEHKQMEQELIKAQKLKSTGILAGGIAHDFNNLLTGIMGNVSLAKVLSTDSPKVEAKLVEAEKACLRAKDLTQQLLTFAKGGTPLIKTESLEATLTDSVGFALSGSKVKSEIDLEKGLWSVKVDLGQINQVIQNVVFNAVQAMKNGGTIKISARNLKVDDSSLLPLEEGSYVKLSIADSGTGISTEHLEHIFDPYFSTRDDGVGLGLASVYSIITNHLGHIAVDSAEGEGATFHIYLPAADAEVQFTFSDLQEVIPRQVSGRILVMDDEELIREIATGILEHLGYVVATAVDGGAAVELYTDAMDKEPFDAVLLDLTVPGGIGGKEALLRLKKIDPEVRAIVSSGYSNDPIMSDFRGYGFVDVVAKPYSLDQVKEVLHRVLDSQWG